MFPRRSTILGSRPLRDQGFFLPLRTSLVGSDGRVATFTRPSKAWYEDASGVIREVAEGMPRLRADRGCLIEEPRTNRLLWSRDWTQAAWLTAGWGSTATRDQIGADGIANRACRITATAPNGQARQSVTGLASAARIGSVYIKRAVGTGAVRITNGLVWQEVTLTTSWRRFEITRAADTAFTIGVQLAVVGDAVDVDFAQVEEGTFATSPIWTEGTPLARAADVLSVSTAGWPLTRGRIGIRYNGEKGGGRTLFTTGSLSGVVGRVGTSSLSCYVNGIFVGDAVMLPKEFRLTCEWGDGSSRWFVDSAGPVGVRALVPSALAPLAYVGSENGFSYFANGWLADLEVSHV
jgi:hypothetical protein